jgi:hypothetical protein
MSPRRLAEATLQAAVNSRRLTPLREFTGIVAPLIGRFHRFTATTKVIDMFPCPAPQKWSQIVVNVPAVCRRQRSPPPSSPDLDQFHRSSTVAEKESHVVTSSPWIRNVTVSPLFKAYRARARMQIVSP